LIYLDHNATSPLLPEVRAAMDPWWGVPANPASAHRAGQAAMAAVEQAREHVARLMGGVPEGVVFCSGATEANHIHLRARYAMNPGPIWVSALEHPCVQGALDAVQAPKYALPVNPLGQVVLPADTRDAVGVVLMAAHHETGVLQPVNALKAHAEAGRFWVHVDATQAAGKVPLSLGWAQGVTLSSHKLGGPGGMGALLLQDGEPFPPLFPGSQERGRRGGTVFTAGAVGFGEACRAALEQLQAKTIAHEALRARVEAGAKALGATVLGEGAPRVPGTVLMRFGRLKGESVVQGLDLRGICVSSGAACSSGSLKASPALVAMGDAHPEGPVRVSLGPSSTAEEVDALLAALGEVVPALEAAAEWEF